MRKKICVCLIVVTLATLAVGFALPQPLWAQGALENPQSSSFQSGIGLISGWVCDASQIDIVIDDTATIQAAYGTERGDTISVCGDTDNGFGLLFNWNLLGDGQHTISALADRVEFGSATFTVTTLGTEFLSGASGTCTAQDFPLPGQSTTLKWQEGAQNFVISSFSGSISEITPGLYIGTTSQTGYCATSAHTSSVCDVRLNITAITGGGSQVSPSPLVDISTYPQCFGTGLNDSVSFMLFSRCDQPLVMTYYSCSNLPLTNGSYQFTLSDNVTITISCVGTTCSGTVSARSPFDPSCTAPAFTWSASLATAQSGQTRAVFVPEEKVEEVFEERFEVVVE